jgi:hypothetical protein
MAASMTIRHEGGAHRGVEGHDGARAARVADVGAVEGLPEDAGHVRHGRGAHRRAPRLGRQILRRLGIDKVTVTPTATGWTVSGALDFAPVLGSRTIAGGSDAPSGVKGTLRGPPHPQPLVTPRRSRGEPRRGVLPEDRA